MDFAASKSLAIPANSRYIFYQNIRGGGSLLVGLTGLEHYPRRIIGVLVRLLSDMLGSKGVLW